MKARVRNWIGIAAAAAIGASATGFGLVQATGTSGDNTLTAIAPCRLVDTRADAPIGPRTTPLGANETVTFTATGNNGDCKGIAADAQAIEVQLTSSGATEEGYLTRFPANLTKAPNVSHVNLQPGEIISNSTVISLSPTGQFKLYNYAGSTDVIIDVLGVFSPSDGAGTPGPQGPAGPAGADGPAGPAGPGEEGIAGYYVTNRTVSVPAGDTVSNVRTCDKYNDGSYVAISGGVTADNDGARAAMTVIESGPGALTKPAGANITGEWTNTVRNDGARAVAFRSWAVCAKVGTPPTDVPD